MIPTHSSVWANPTFRLLFQIGAMQSIARWLELLAFGVFVFDITQSPLVVSLVTLARFAPLALFGPITGALASQMQRRSLYIVGLSIMWFTCAAGAVLAKSGLLNVWQIILISFVGGLFWVLDFPVRRALIGDLVQSSQLGDAMSLDTIANNATRMLGPILGGLMLQYLGLSGTFLLSLCIYSFCLIMVWKLPLTHSSVTNGSVFSVRTNIREATDVVRANPVLMAVLMVTVVYNLFAFPMLSLVPVLGRDELALSVVQVGMLASMEGTGALIGGVLLFFFGKVRMYRKIYIGGAQLSLVLGFFYAWVQSVSLVGAALFFVGIGSACFAAMQTTLLVLNSSARYRSQLFGLLSLSIGSGLIGFMMIGALANFLGTRQSLAISSVSGLLCLLIIVFRWPIIIGVQKRAQL